MKISITVDVEEWFHSNWFDSNSIISKYYGDKQPITDVVERTNELVNLFDNNNVKATFFVLGETAIKYPQLINLLERSQHEFASHGFYHNKVYLDNNEFIKDIIKYKNEVKSNIDGFRFPNFNYTNNKLQILVKEGFLYDSSVVPCLKIPGWYGESDAPIIPYAKKIGKNSIMEFPISVMPYVRLPGSGGWFLRNIGYLWTKFLIKTAKNSDYGMIYIHPWEISENNPSLNEIPFHVFRNTGKKTFQNMEKLIKNLSECNFITLSEQLVIRKGMME